MLRRRTSSRLNRTAEKQNKKQAIIFVVGTVILLFSLIQFGPFLINAFGNLIFSLRGAENNSQLTGSALLQPPTLFNIPNATHSASISFTGEAQETNGTVEIYVNNDLSEEIEINDKQEFRVEDLTLSSSSNSIKARFIKDKKTSAFSKEYTVTLLKEKPKLDEVSPSNNSTFTKADRKINVSGKTDPENAVEVNGFRAIVDSDGSFSYLLELKDGENNINVTAKNPAGVTNTQEIKVIFNP